MPFDEKQRHNMYIEAYRELIENSVYSKWKLNTERDNKHKKKVNKYHYFTVKVRIGNNTYNVVLDTEEFDGDKIRKPQITSLYNVKEVSPSKKNSTKAGFENNGETSHNSDISQSEINVKYEQAVYEDVFLQRAFVGSRVDWDRPSLEAIGTGEGAMAHGWGNYLLKDRKTNKIGYFDHWNERKVFDMLHSLSNI